MAIFSNFFHEGKITATFQFFEAIFSPLFFFFELLFFITQIDFLTKHYTLNSTKTEKTTHPINNIIRVHNGPRTISCRPRQPSKIQVCLKTTKSAVLKMEQMKFKQFTYHTECIRKFRWQSSEKEINECPRKMASNPNSALFC